METVRITITISVTLEVADYAGEQLIFIIILIRRCHRAPVFPGEDKLGLCVVSRSGTRKAAALYCFGRSHRTTLPADFHAVIAVLRSGSFGEEELFLRGSFSTAREKLLHGSPGRRSELRLSRHDTSHRALTSRIEVANTITRSSVWSRMNCAGREPPRWCRNLI